jgi:tRNA(Arg) A34 adenosine deaminase TadA
LSLSAVRHFIFRPEGEWIVCESSRSLLDLVEWIYMRHTPHALRILRERIVLSAPATSFEKALIKVAAKRFEESPTQFKGKDFNAEHVDGAELSAMRAAHIELSAEKYSKSFSTSFTNLQTAADWVRAEAGELAAKGAARFKKDRAVVAAIFDSDFKLLAASRNTNAIIRTRHAEINLLESLRNIKGAATLIVSTQCCRMCAAAIADFFADHPIAIFYLAREPALAGVRTALWNREKLVPQARE